MDRAVELARRLSGAIADDRVLSAIAAVPRERFVAAADRDRAYDNVALPIDCGQTISQPIVVARMLELLELSPEDRVLDVGTGSGYHAALLSLLAAEVWTIERHPKLSAAAQDALASLGRENVTCLVGDGSLGLPDRAPFDAINVAAAAGLELPRGARRSARARRPTGGAGRSPASASGARAADRGRRASRALRAGQVRAARA